MSPDEPPSPRLPDACAVAFKEWSGVCAALSDGRQSLILRKGGIEEGPEGFRPEHPTFWLYPTFVHQAEQGLRVPAPGPAAPEGLLDLEALAVVAVLGRADSPEQVAALADLHIWTEETILKRFAYRRPGLWVLGVRVYRRATPWRITVTPDQAGCTTWVPLERPLPTDGLHPVLDGPEFARRMAVLRAAVPGLRDRRPEDRGGNMQNK